MITSYVNGSSKLKSQFRCHTWRTGQTTSRQTTGPSPQSAYNILSFYRLGLNEMSAHVAANARYLWISPWLRWTRWVTKWIKLFGRAKFTSYAGNLVASVRRNESCLPPTERCYESCVRMGRVVVQIGVSFEMFCFNLIAEVNVSLSAFAQWKLNWIKWASIHRSRYIIEAKRARITSDVNYKITPLFFTKMV